MDESTQAILTAHAAMIESLAAGQAALTETLQTTAQTQQALLGLLERQHAEGNATSAALTSLVQGIRQAQATAEQHRQAAAQRMAELKTQMMGTSGVGGNPG